ncbi:hypothetical protein SRABI128_01991 [Microbacterium sp. Bi128]|nr:hypothetical protein SRABI128_01991 [Microbacterium sp. Bi128]
MRAEVIDRRDPLADDLLQLRNRIHRLTLNIVPTTRHVRTLVAGELLQERVESAKEALHRALVGGLVDTGWLD